MPSLHHFILLFYHSYPVTELLPTMWLQWTLTTEILSLISSTNGSSSQIWRTSLEAFWDEWDKHKGRDNLKTWCLWPQMRPTERHKAKAYILLPSVLLSSDCSSFLVNVNDKPALPVLTRNCFLTGVPFNTVSLFRIVVFSSKCLLTDRLLSQSQEPHREAGAWQRRTNRNTCLSLDRLPSEWVNTNQQN